MKDRRAILERLERGLMRDIKRTTKRLDIVRKLMALDHEREETKSDAAARSAEESLLEAACGLIEAHGGEMHVRELEEQLAALAGEDRVQNLHSHIHRHPERIVRRQNGFVALAPVPVRKRRDRATEIPTWPPRIVPVGSGDAANRQLTSSAPTERRQRPGRPERPSRAPGA